MFERNNVLEASRTRTSGLWAHALSPKKVKANRTPPDKAFLAELDDEKTGWRVRLAKDMKRLDPALDGELITAAVQLLIDRLIFVKVLSDREIEDAYLAQLAERVERAGLSEQAGSWFDACRDIFEKLNEFYNGSIFEPRPELEAVQVSNKVVREVIRALQPDYSPYNFAVLPVEILGTIYERFLGRVVRATGQRVKIEDKPAVRKAGGVFYTPQYIVGYIVQHSVGALLADCRTPADVAKLKILDPACGSGSFLLGAYDALIEWHKRYYDSVGAKHSRVLRQAQEAANASPLRDAAYYDADGRIRLTARLKRQILLNNIFGVDIDEQAVEVTRLSLSLKALEDTRHDELAEERTLFNQTVLPDLSRNIQCGNSLIGPDYFAGQLMPDVAELKRVKPFDWQRAFPQVFAPTPSPSPVARTATGEGSAKSLPRAGEGRVGGGFDCIIGNPPYVRQEILGEGFKTYAKKKYGTYAGTADLYTYFIECGVSLLKHGGLFGFIIANKWMRANYGEPLRRWLKQQRIEEITDFGDLPVFESATTYPCILRIAKDTPQSTFQATQVDTLDFNSLSDYVQSHHYTVDQLRLDDGGWSLSNESAQALLEKLRELGMPLGEYVNRQIYYGIKTGLNEAFVIDAEKRTQLIAEDPKSAELIKPFFAGRDITSYHTPSSERFLIFTRHGINIKNYSAIQNHLAQFKERLMPKPKDWKGSEWHGRKPGAYQWYEIQDAVDYYAEFEKPKIVVPAILRSATYTLDRKGFYSNDKTSIIVSDDLYLLGILNSKVPDFVMHSISSTKQGGYFEYKPMYLTQLPIRLINFSDPADRARHERMVALVTHMLDLHQQRAAAKTKASQELYQRQIDATDQQIDHLVYELYGLTDEEIAIVES